MAGGSADERPARLRPRAPSGADSPHACSTPPPRRRTTGPVPVLDFADFARALPAQGALLGLDPGAKRIGAAVCDPGRIIASPLETIARTRFAADAARIFALADTRAVVGLVIGLPLKMDGAAGPAAQAARAFAGNLARLRDWPILLWDERLSTAAVTRTLIDADASRRRRGELVDKLAAAYLLQGAIDRLQEGRFSPPRTEE